MFASKLKLLIIGEERITLENKQTNKLTLIDCIYIVFPRANKTKKNITFIKSCNCHFVKQSLLILLMIM